MMHRSLNFVCMLCTLALAASAFAQNNAEPTQVDAAREALNKARGEYADATAAASRAEVARMRLEKSIRVEFSSKPDLADARNYLGECTRYYNSLRNAVRSEFERDPDYSALRDDIAEADQELQAARDDETTSLGRTLKLMHALMAARGELTRYEAAAFALDPAIEDARLQMNAAYETSKKLDRYYQLRANNDPRLKTAEAEIAHAKDRVVQSRQAVIAAGEKLAAAEKSEAQRKARRRNDLPPIHKPDP